MRVICISYGRPSGIGKADTRRVSIIDGGGAGGL